MANETGEVRSEQVARSGEHPEDRESREDRIARRRAALQELSGMLTGAYPPGYLDDLRGEWPE